MTEKHFAKFAKALTTVVFILLVPTAICYYSLLQLHSSSKLVAGTQVNISVLEQLVSTMKDAETGIRGYLVTDDESFLEPYLNAKTRVRMNYGQIRNLTQDEKQQTALVLLDKQINNNFKVLNRLYVLNSRKSQVPLALMKTQKFQMDQLRATVRKMHDYETGLLSSRISAETDNMIYTTVLILAIILIEVALIYWFYRKLTLIFNRVFSLKNKLRKSHVLMNRRVEAIQKVTYRISRGEYDIKLNEDEKGNLGILSSSINIMSAALNQSFAEKDELMQQKDDFIGIASHELKTPLTSIKAIIQIITKMNDTGVANKSIHPLLFRANSQVKRLTQIVENLLDVAKINEKKVELQLVEFNIANSIKECAQEVMPPSSSHKLILKGDLDATVLADKFRIDQVLVNLLSNAVKYSPDADRVIAEVRTHQEQVEVMITDFGIGIPADKQRHIFDRYYRVHSSSQSFSGLGLGLYISSEIIKKHGGSIGIESGEGGGTSFWLRFPSTKKFNTAPAVTAQAEIY